MGKPVFTGKRPYLAARRVNHIQAVCRADIQVAVGALDDNADLIARQTGILCPVRNGTVLAEKNLPEFLVRADEQIPCAGKAHVPDPDAPAEVRSGVLLQGAFLVKAVQAVICTKPDQLPVGTLGNGIHRGRH